MRAVYELLWAFSSVLYLLTCCNAFDLRGRNFLSNRCIIKRSAVVLLRAKRRTNLSPQRKPTNNSSPDPDQGQQLPIGLQNAVPSSSNKKQKEDLSPEMDDKLFVVMPALSSLEQYEKYEESVKRSMPKPSSNIGNSMGSSLRDRPKFFQSDEQKRKAALVSSSGGLDELLQTQQRALIDRTEEAPSAAMEAIKGAFSTVLIADFFVIIFFLVWFLLAAALQSTYPVVLERFQDIFQPVVVPCLTLLMTGSIASGALENMKKKRD